MADVFLARCALGEGDAELAQGTLAKAGECLQQADLPTVAWRVYVLQENTERSVAAVNELLAGLESAPELQACFKRSPTVQKILQ